MLGWFTFKFIGRCVVCRKLFFRSWPWTFYQEHCSAECSDEEFKHLAGMI